MKNWHAYATMDSKLNNWHTFGTLACLLARWHVKMRSWHALGTLARRPLARMARMTRDLPNSHMLCESVNVK